MTEVVGEHLLESAIRLAAKVHKGQKDRAQKPYILHVMRVMMRGTDLEEQLLGALHDVLERSELTVAQLAEKGFPAQVLKALEHISRVEGEDYETYIDRVAQDGLALRVKLHDLSDKMDSYILPLGILLAIVVIFLPQGVLGLLRAQRKAGT